MMDAVLEISTTNYDTDLVLVKKALSQMETLAQEPNGYVLSEPTSNFGWTFFKLALKENLQKGIEEKFADMINSYKLNKQPEQFAKFLVKICKISKTRRQIFDRRSFKFSIKHGPT